MRFITKLWVTLLFLCVAGVANAAKTYEVDQKFTSIAELDGQAFAIVNEADTMAVFGSGNQNLGYASITTAVTGSGNSGYYFKLEASSIEGAYLLRLQTPAGEPYIIGGNPGYLNSQPADGSCSFILGLGSPDHVEGQDGDYLATWFIEVSDGKFALKNKATGLYLKDNGPAKYEEATYFTFCTLKEGEEVPDPEPEVIPEPTAPLADGELIPDFFSICDEGGIPYGYEVKFGSEDRAYPATFTGGARMFNFAEGGDFTKGIYYREGYVQYGNVKKLPLDAGKKYIVYFNSAMWKSSGATLVFTITKEGDEAAALTQTINNAPDVNGSKAAVSGSTRSEIEFTPESDGNYILKWNAEGWKEVLLANVGVKVASDEAPTEAVVVDWIAGEQGYENAYSLDNVEIAIDAKTTMICSKGTGKNEPKYYTSGSAVRTYGGNVITFKGEGITKIVITGVSGKVTDLTASTGELSTDGIITTWTGEADEVVLTNETSNQQHIAKLHVVYGGEEPYIAPIHIANTAETAYTVAEAFDLINAGDALNDTVFVKGFVSQVDSFNENYKSIQYWISDDGTTDKQLECYSGKGIDGADFESVEDITVGAAVVVKGTLTKYGDIYEFSRNNELVAYEFIAPPQPAAPVTPGYYLLYNVGAGQYFTKGNGWGTQASITDNANTAVAVELIPNGDNFQIRTGVGNNAYGLEYLNGGTVYTDQSRNKVSTWSFVSLTTEAGVVYNIISAENHGGGEGAYLTAEGGESTIVGPGTDGTSAYAQWTLVPLINTEEALAALDGATQDKPVDATGVIINPDFTYSALSKFWTMEASNQNLCGGAASNPCAESWRSAFTLSQTLTVPNGVYALTAQAAMTEYTVTGEDLPVVYANEATATFPAMVNGENSMTLMSEQFSAGNYVVGPIYVEVADSTLTIGVKGTRTDTWCIWDNFQLKYFGPEATVDGAKFDALKAQIAELKAEAAALKGDKAISAAAVKAIDAAVVAADSAVVAEPLSEDDLNAAISGLQQAVNQGKAVIAETMAAYDSALASIYDGKSYRVFATVNDVKYYLTTSGKLVDDANLATSFTFTAVEANGTLYPTGWNLGCKFTNPTLTGGSTGDIKQTGQINLGGTNDRNDWERQVFFEKDGYYKVRATNANSANWGANTYWAVVLDADSLPQAGYVLADVEDYNYYVWQIEGYVDNRPAAFEKVQSWVGKLQAIEGQVTNASQWTSNAKEPSEGSYEALLDGNYTSFFHSQWSGTAVDADHYLQAELPEAIQDFYFYFKKRSDNNNNRPTDILVQGSNDGETFTDITEITEGLPTAAETIDYMSAKISASEAYKYIRFSVKATNNGAVNNGHPFFTFSEFYILPADELVTSATQYMVDAYTSLTDDDVEPINALDEQIEAAYGDAQDAAEIAATKDAILEIIAIGNEISQKAKSEDMFAQDDVDAKMAAITTLDEAKAGLAEVKQMVYEYVAEIEEPESAIDITKVFIVNPEPMKKDGWEGTDFGDASDGVCEYWNKPAAEFHQTISLPAGYYKLTAIAMQRTGMTGYVYAGDVQTPLASVGSDVVNNRSQASNWFAQGNGVNEVEFSLAEAGDVVIGIQADADNGDHWTVWKSFKLEKVAKVEEDPCVGTKTVNVERTPSATWATVVAVPAEDIVAAAEALNAQASDLTFQLVETSGEVYTTYNATPAPAFWLDENGNHADWGTTNKFYVIYSAETPEITTGLLPDVTAGFTGKAVVRLANADGKYYEFTINLSVIAPPTKFLENYTSKGTVEVELYPTQANSAYDAVLSDDYNESDVSALIGEAWGAIYGVGADVDGKATLTDAYSCDPAPGFWCLTDGTADVWANSTFGVSLIFSEDQSTFHFSAWTKAALENPVSTTFYLVNEETKEYVAYVVKLDNYPLAINAVNGDLKNATIYDLNGRKVNNAQKGIYIVNGKKVLVK